MILNIKNTNLSNRFGTIIANILQFDKQVKNICCSKKITWTIEQDLSHSMEQSDNIEQILTLLGQGKIWIHPTDTVWGMGCDATNTLSIQKLYSLKKRPLDKTMILLASDMAMVKKYVKEVHPKIDNLLHYSERPITVLYPDNGMLPSELVNPYGEVAIRIVKEPWLQSIIHSFGKPLVATSANLHGRKFPINFAHIDQEILEGVDYVAFRGRTNKTPSEPSVVITLNEKDDIVFLRE